MTTKDAAAFLEITERTLIRYANAGKIKKTQVRGKTGMVSDYALPDLEKLKRELNPTYEGPAEGEVVTDATSPESDVSEASSQAGQQLAVIERPPLTQLTSPEKAMSDVLLLGIKKLLTIEETALITGLSSKRLRDDIKSGNLKAGRVGRSFRIRPTDLDKYLSELF